MPAPPGWAPSAFAMLPGVGTCCSRSARGWRLLTDCWRWRGCVWPTPGGMGTAVRRGAARRSWLCLSSFRWWRLRFVSARAADEDVLNGIAYNPSTKDYYFTGKKWRVRAGGRRAALLALGRMWPRLPPRAHLHECPH